MKTYHLTSDNFTGFVKLVYDEQELLVSYDSTTATLTEKQQVWLLKKLPRELSELQHMLSLSSGAKVTEVKQEVTFELFWKRYNETRSNKKRTEAKWKKMPENECIKAYLFISKYEASIPPGCGKKYAETYLNSEIWNN